MSALEWDRWFFFCVFGGFLFVSLMRLVVNARTLQIMRQNDRQKVGFSLIPDDVREAARAITSVIDGDKQIKLTLEIKDREG